MSRQGGGENAITPSGDVQSGGSSKAANLRPFWIAGILYMLLYSLYISNCFVTFGHVQALLCYLFLLISIINNIKSHFVI
jgi:hypothetical protein